MICYIVLILRCKNDRVDPQGRRWLSIWAELWGLTGCNERCRTYERALIGGLLDFKRMAL